MGAITDQVQHEHDVTNLRMVGEICPSFKRHLSHHLRNVMAGIMSSAELAQRNLEVKSLEAMQNDLARIISAVEHMDRDLREVGL